jgi:hypothetical protein
MLDNGKDSPLVKASSLNVLRKHYAGVDGVALWIFSGKATTGTPVPGIEGSISPSDHDRQESKVDFN